MKKLVRLVALSVMAFSLSTGIAAASTGSIGTTGPDSYNKIESETRRSVRVENNNEVGVGNVNLQSASSGRAKVQHNTTGGSARSGDAMNDNLTRTTVRINNGSSSAALNSNCGCSNNTGSIRNTGPDSTNKIEFKDSSRVKVTNNNSVGVLNLSAQQAKSGSAEVKGNTTGGSATSGDASNVNTTETTVNITN